VNAFSQDQESKETETIAGWQGEMGVRTSAPTNLMASIGGHILYMKPFLRIFHELHFPEAVRFLFLKFQQIASNLTLALRNTHQVALNLKGSKTVMFQFVLFSLKSHLNLFLS